MEFSDPINEYINNPLEMRELSIEGFDRFDNKNPKHRTATLIANPKF